MAFHRDSGSGGKRGGQRFGGARKPFAGGKSFGGNKSFGGAYGGKPMMHSAVCSDCGASCQVPFKPNGSRPVLCSRCFGNEDGRSGEKSFAPKRFDHSSKPFSGGGTGTDDLLREINNKLDLIIRSLND